MKNDSLSPEKSFELITQVINEAKTKFEENGFIYVLWGALIAIATLSQFILLKNEYFSINYYPYFIMPIGAIFTAYYFFNRDKGKQNQISKIVSVAWIILSLNLMVLGFAYAVVLKQNLMPIMLILQGIGMAMSGGAIKSKLIFYAGIAVNISGFISFSLDWIHQPLLAGIISIIAIFIPGIILLVKHNKAQNV